jgi:transketolase
MSDTTRPIEKLSINTIRTLAMDAVEAAKSGHPGTPMALAPAAYVLWNEVLRFDPAQPAWPNRDRFVLSCGHASMLLFSLLHLAEVRQLDAQGRATGEPAVSLDEIRRFRQIGSRCPGHPEHGHTSGVETTTGPLGQGIGNSVGMAIAGRWLAARYNRPGFELFDYNVYAFCSDGDMMEGVGSEVASLAGHLRLPKLCWIYDDNTITIEGHTSLSFSEDVAARFAGYHWNVVKVGDVNDLDAVRAALTAFHKTTDRPTLIIVRSVIAWGAPTKHNTAEAHGAPLGDEEVRATKLAYGWPPEAKFLVPPEVPEHFRAGLGARGAAARQAWEQRFAAYRKQFPELAAELEMMARCELPPGWDRDLPVFPADAKGVASRVSSGKALNAAGKRIPWLLGGAADLAPSTRTLLEFEGAGDFLPGAAPAGPGGRNFHFGIREHAMGSISNGMALCGLRPYAATFFVFADYMRPPIRLAALMGLPVLYVFTHDSIGVGEDGPTHQPIEHLASLRAIPNLLVIRPGDANEVTAAYRVALGLKNRPVAFALTRQNLPTLDRTKYAPASGLAKGGYVLADPAGPLVGTQPEIILIGTGSELGLCVAAYEKLSAEGVPVRLVSLPCWELFDEQPEEYRAAVLPAEIHRRLAVEAGVEQGWSKYVGPSGRFLGMEGFGTSGPVGAVFKHFGFTVEHVVATAKELL